MQFLTFKKIRCSFLSICIASTAFLSACSEDEEKVDPNARIPFLGSYEVLDHNSEESEYFNFILEVKESTKGPDKVELKNFRYINNGLVGTIKNNKLVISQVFEDSDEKVEITGEGILNGDQLTYSYKIVLTEKGQGTEVFENTAEAVKIE